MITYLTILATWFTLLLHTFEFLNAVEHSGAKKVYVGM